MNKRLQPRLAQIGRIRVGDRKGTRGAPQRLKTFRLTVPYASKPILHVCAHLYGGDVQQWENPETGREFELYTTVNSLKVLILPRECVVAYCEMWNRSGLVRRCDGETILADNEEPARVGHPCLCPDDIEERQALAKDGRACADKTRISVMLPDVPAIGLWRLDTGSYYGATEAMGQVSLLQQLGITSPVEAVLAIEEHKRKRILPGKDKPETRRFLVPTLRILMTPKQVLLEMPQQEAQKQLQSPQERIADVWGDRVDTRTGEVVSSDGDIDAVTPQEAAEPDDAPEPSVPLPQDEKLVTVDPAQREPGFLGTITQACEEHNQDTVQVCALACWRYNVDHVNALTAGQQKTALKWVTSEGGRVHLGQELTKYAKEIDEWLNPQAEEEAEAALPF